MLPHSAAPVWLANVGQDRPFPRLAWNRLEAKDRKGAARLLRTVANDDSSGTQGGEARPHSFIQKRVRGAVARVDVDDDESGPPECCWISVGPVAAAAAKDDCDGEIARREHLSTARACGSSVCR
jgi:hypothetical protein